MGERYWKIEKINQKEQDMSKKRSKVRFQNEVDLIKVHDKSSPEVNHLPAWICLMGEGI